MFNIQHSFIASTPQTVVDMSSQCFYDTIIDNVPCVTNKSEVRLIFLGGHAVKFQPPTFLCAVFLYAHCHSAGGICCQVLDIVADVQKLPFLPLLIAADVTLRARYSCM